MTTKFNSNFNETTPFSDNSVRLHLTASTVTTYTVPGTGVDKYSASFVYASNSNVIVGKNVVPTIPAANTAETTYFMDYKPCKRYVNGGDVLQFITPDATAYCGVSLLKLP